MTTTRTRPDLTDEELIEDLEWIADGGDGFLAACKRTGFNASGLDARLRRLGRVDLLTRLRDLDPARVDPPHNSVANGSARYQAWVRSPEGQQVLAAAHTTRTEALRRRPATEHEYEQRRRAAVGGAA